MSSPQPLSSRDQSQEMRDKSSSEHKNVVDILLSLTNRHRNDESLGFLFPNIPPYKKKDGDENPALSTTQALLQMFCNRSVSTRENRNKNLDEDFLK